MKKLLNVTINGQPTEVLVKSSITLADLLRVQLGLTGTKKACDVGACGSCTVLIDGKSVKSCSILALQTEGKQVNTIEGLADGPKLHPLQDAFIEHQGFQCGFCAPGMIMTAKALLDENPNPTRDEVKMGIVGNLCRCTGYVRVEKAILAAAGELQKEAK